MSRTAPIVVGVDGSASSQDGVRWAAADAALRHASLLLVSISSLPVDYLGYGTAPEFVPQSFFADQQGHGQSILIQAAVLARDAARGLGDVRIHTRLLRGSPIPRLLEHSHTAQMVVLGSRGLGEFTGSLRGSVSSAVAAHARCPVAVIPGLPGPKDAVLGGPVVVGVDGSPRSEPAIAAAFEEASLRRVDLIAVHAWTDITVSPVFPGAGSEKNLDWAAIEIGGHAVLAESLAGWQEEYPDVPVRTVVVHDRPVRNLVQQADNAQLVVVGSHGRGGFPGMLLGSTSTALLHTIQRPLLVVRGNT